jgi:hypothetical protein
LQQLGSLWKGFRPDKTDVQDSAFIVELLTLKKVEHQLQRYIESFDQHVLEFRKALINASRQAAWPAVFGSNAEASLFSSIGVLAVLARPEAGIDPFLAKLAAERIAKELSEAEGGKRLDSWDWMNLGCLSAALLEWSGEQALGEADSQKIMQFGDSLRKSRLLVPQLVKLSMSSAPKEIDGTILFVLAKGIPGKGKHTLSALRWVSSAWARPLLWLGKWIADKALLGLGKVWP